MRLAVLLRVRCDAIVAWCTPWAHRCAGHRDKERPERMPSGGRPEADPMHAHIMHVCRLVRERGGMNGIG